MKNSIKKYNNGSYLNVPAKSSWNGNLYSNMNTANPYQMENGGDLTQYPNSAGTHEESPLGGIPVGNSNLVEGGETRGPKGTNMQDYIYSDTLKVPGKKYTFAKASKMIETKHSKRDNDRLSEEQKERELGGLMNQQEEIRNKMMQNTIQKCYGGMMNKMEYGGNTNLWQSGLTGAATGAATGAIAGAPVGGVGAIPGAIIGGVSGFIGGAFKGHKEDEAIKQQQLLLQQQNEQQNEQFIDPRQQFMNKAGGFINKMGRIYTEGGTLPFSTPKGTYDENLNLVNGPYGSDLNPGLSSEERDNNWNAMMKANEEAKNQPFNQTKSFDFGNSQNPISNNNSGVYSTPDSPGSDSKSFDYNKLYNLGNYAGAAYDIYRGAKGGDKVNYERVSPQTVDYSASREMNRRDINSGFRGTQSQLKNVNNPAQYLSLIGQTAANRDKAISDSNDRSFENEKNTNAQLLNQSKYFNAQTQKSEADARQMEKDIAKNTLSTGLYNAGMAATQTGVDKKSYISQNEAKKLLGTGDYSYEYDSNGKINGIKSRITNKVTPIK